MPWFLSFSLLRLHAPAPYTSPCGYQRRNFVSTHDLAQDNFFFSRKTEIFFSSPLHEPSPVDVGNDVPGGALLRVPLLADDDAKLSVGSWLRRHGGGGRGRVLSQPEHLEALAGEGGEGAAASTALGDDAFAVFEGHWDGILGNQRFFMGIGILPP